MNTCDGKIGYDMECIVHGSKIQNESILYTFRSASTDLDHALVICDLTQILPPVFGSGHRQPMRDQDL